MAERYNAPLIEFNPFSKKDDDRPWYKSITFYVMAALVTGVGVAVFIIMKINTHSYSQDSKDSSASAEPTLQKVMLDSAQDVPDKKPEDVMYVSGIISGGEPVAVIGGKMFKVGEAVNNYMVKSIGNNYVEFLDKNGHSMIKEVGK